ncbi:MULTISPECIES: hypothetical protein [Empedobacter]|jgi:hypothetical protein|uniref:Uncharacterized protein n=1 Tax=Empedobacter falsenii TaxID=343874 RepID=A0A376J541_9FLAO|nr:MULTISPECIES: hypothetical protein [Empedobacter]RRT94053.1 hypothetical protein EGI89_01415 [Empedobacter falsenii]RRT94247.1 hypothetical protein EGI88_01420 [Empedobacter falsenii]STE54793.1 Uncharacterised protein [Empedobacter falsenii]
MEEKAVVTPDEVVTDTITNLFTYANYFLVAALVVLLTYMTIRDFKKKQREKKLSQERESYNNQFDNEEEKEDL